METSANEPTMAIFSADPPALSSNTISPLSFVVSSGYSAGFQMRSSIQPALEDKKHYLAVCTPA